MIRVTLVVTNHGDTNLSGQFAKEKVIGKSPKVCTTTLIIHVPSELGVQTPHAIRLGLARYPTLALVPSLPRQTHPCPAVEASLRACKPGQLVHVPAVLSPPARFLSASCHIQYREW